MNNYIMALFASGTTNFDYAGMGALKDAFSAVATETATSNGNITYTMEMTYPVNGYLADKLVEGNLIKAQVSKTPGDYMIFEINETLKSDDTTITVYCDAYANRILRMSFDNGGKFGSFGNVQQALNAARAQMTGIQSDFTLSSGIGTGLNMSGVTSKNTMPTTYQDFNAYLDAIMDKVQGNVRFGINSVQIVSDRGRDITDTVLRDDKNTNGISIKVDTSNIVNRIIPILPVLDKDGNVTQETKVGKIVTSSVAFKFINFYAGQVVSVDTQDLADSYFNRTNCDRPTTTATVQTSMLDEDLTDIRLFDRVQVYSSKIGYQAKLRVSERAFDILAGAVSEFKLGSSSVTVFNSQTSVINAVNSAVQSSQYAAITADGKNTAYYEGTTPGNPKENDLWFHSVDGVNQIDQYVNGNWVTIVSDSTGEQINQKVSQLGAEAQSAVAKAESVSGKADQLASKFDDTNQKADQALGNSFSAQADAASAVAKAESTASEFGKVSQKTDSTAASALNAQNAASDAVKQASSAAADSKDAKQIAGAVSQSYKTLTDGSTMTIAELESGLAVKLTKTDLDGYATQTWTQNQVKVTADGINGTMSSIKSTVDGQTTSINDLKADSSSFKSQFTTVNNTLGKQTTDISTLQASSKELTSGFNTLTSDNTTNKNDISQLKQTSTEVSSTLETVKTQVQDSAVGINLAIGTNQEYAMGYGIPTTTWQDGYAYLKLPTATYNNGEILPQDPHTFWYGLTQGVTYTQTIWFETDATIKDLGVTQISWYINSGHDFQPAMLVNLGGNKYKIYSTYTWPGKSDNDVQLFDIFYLSSAFDLNTGSYLKFGKLKLEKGNLSTDWCLNPAENATITAMSKLSQTVDSIQTDISKKIEQKDLNGYATQDWSNNQIKITADGINGAISSIKNTVDDHTTNIHDIQADSKEFKSQFTTYKDTVDRHDRDISTIKADAKSLSSNFDSLDSDNKTNQHNIGELQQSANEFSSTLTTVQAQYNGISQSQGRNYVRNSRFDSHMDNWYLTAGAGILTIDTTQASQTYLGKIGLHIYGTTTDNFQGISQSIPLKMTKGQKFVIGMLQSFDGGPSSGKLHIGVHYRDSNETILSQEWHDLNCDAGWSNVYGRNSFVYTAADDCSSVNLMIYAPGPNYNFNAYITEVSLTVGPTSFGWQAAPEDLATVTAVSSISQTIDSIQTTVRGKVDNDVYQSKVVQLSNQLTSVVGQVNTLGQRNLVANSQFQYDKFDGSTWTSDKASNWYSSDSAWSWRNGYQGICCNIPISNPVNTSQWNAIVSKKIYVPDPASVYSASAIFNVDKIGGCTLLVLDWYDQSMKRIGYAVKEVTVFGTQTLVKIENQTPPEGTAYVALHVDVNGGGHLAVIAPMLVNAASVGSYVPDNASWTEVQQTASDINLKVSKDGVINAINISNEGTTIYGNKLHITAATYIDNAVIKDAMIANLSASKLTAGSINAANINVYNLNGANIVANSITAAQLQAGAIQVSLNNTLQTLKINPDGLALTDKNGVSQGLIHTNNVTGYPNILGLNFDLSSTGKYMAWSAQDEGDPHGDYRIKFSWWRGSTASTLSRQSGFQFDDSVLFNKEVRINADIVPNGSKVNMRIGTLGFQNYQQAFIGASNFKAGICFDNSQVYAISSGNWVNASKILFALAGKTVQLPLTLNHDGTIKVYTTVNL